MDTTIDKPQYSIDKKWRKRRHQTAGSLILALGNLSGEFHEIAENTLNARNTLHTAKIKLREAIAEVQKLQAELVEKKAQCKEYTRELEDTVSEVDTSDLGECGEKEKNALNVTIWFGQLGVLNANRTIKAVDRELYTNKVIIRNQKTLEPKNDRPIGSLKIPNIDRMGVIAETGSISVSRTVKCCICLANSVDCVLYRCGHTCCCYTCAIELTKDPKAKACPVCRSSIKKVIKTYVA